MKFDVRSQDLELGLTGLTVFEVHSRSFGGVRAMQAAGKPRNQVVIDAVVRHPLPVVQFDGIESYPLFVGTKYAAGKDVQELVAFVITRCPVIRE
nr:hypothetical protein [Nocardia higoensis]